MKKLGWSLALGPMFVVPAVIVALFLDYIFSSNNSDYLSLVGFYIFASLIGAYVFALIIGLPAALILIKLKKLNLLSLSIVAIGFSTMYGLYYDQGPFEFWLFLLLCSLAVSTGCYYVYKNVRG